MDYLWSPWRYQYVQGANRTSGCVLCEAAAADKDQENFLVYRGRHNFILLNMYPYTTGHLMIVPYEHVGMLEAASAAALQEMMLLAQASQKYLREVYKAPGFNLGMNLGESAGAGIADHLHMHVLPRWPGDTSFITAVAETRVLPEELPVTWRKLREAFGKTG
jgi:ATP adenylyltransferase